MNPEQTERALQRVRHSADPVLSGRGGTGWNIREDFTKELKQSKILEDPDVERAYAFGSSVTEKTDPTDLDLLLRGKDKAANLRLKDKYSSIAPEHEFKDLHVTSTDPDIPFPARRGWSQDETLALKTAGSVAKAGVEKYGDRHKWIRLIGIPFASSLGLLSEGEVQEASAIPKADALKKILPVLDRASTGVMSKASKDLTPRKYELMSLANRLERTGKQLERVPEAEFDRITDIKYGKDQESAVPGHKSAARFNTKSRDITFYLDEISPSSPWHEIVHARQSQSKPVWDYLMTLREHVDRWIADPVDRYMHYAHEFQASAVGEEMMHGHGPVTQSEYDNIYRRSLKDAIQYVETFLKSQDPTFKGKLVKSIAIGSAIGTALAMDVALPSDANAMPRGVFEAIKASAKVYEKSSGAANLIGKELQPGKVISDVIKKGKYDRAIRFTDGTEMNVGKHEITDLNRLFGTRAKMEEFAGKDTPAQTTQALKSLSFHEARSRDIPRSLHREYVDKHLQRLSEMGDDLNPDIVFVSRGDKIFTMPRSYAELLKEIGMIDIVETKKYLDIIKRHQVK